MEMRKKYLELINLIIKNYEKESGTKIKTIDTAYLVKHDMNKLVNSIYTYIDKNAIMEDCWVIKNDETEEILDKCASRKQAEERLDHIKYEDRVYGVFNEYSIIKLA